MYAVGDKVVHPGYGPGVITAVEKRQVIGDAKRYYVIEMLAGGGTLMTPVAQAGKVGLRLAISDASMARLRKSLTKAPSSLPSDFRVRQVEIEERLKGADTFALAKVIRDLAWYDQVHGLTRRDTQLMERAEQALAAELALVEDIEVKAAREWVQTTVAEAVRNRAPVSDPSAVS
jgi:CarD family transcriptional regulator